MSDATLQDDLRVCADGIDTDCRCLTSIPLRRAIERINEQEKIIAELERERDGWKKVVNLAEREIGMLSCAVDPSSSCLVDYCAELSDERTDVLDELAAMRELLETATREWDCGDIAEDADGVWRNAALPLVWREKARNVLEGKEGGSMTERPRIVCLCGSTRFWRTFQEASLKETLAGRIVLSIGAARCADDDDKSFGGYVPTEQYDAVKERLDELHLRKIDLADEVLVLNVDGYIGPSTRRELEYARRMGKPVRFWE